MGIHPLARYHGPCVNASNGRSSRPAPGALARADEESRSGRDQSIQTQKCVGLRLGDPYGLAVLSRLPLEHVTWVDLAGDGLPSLAGVVDVGGQRVRFLVLHTHWPITPSLADARDEALRNAAALASAADPPVVLLGDLNLTPDSPAFDRLLAQGGLRDALHGRGWRPTWLAGFWPLALRIDHVLVSSGVCVEQAEVGPAIGSDHRPVVATLRL